MNPTNNEIYLKIAGFFLKINFRTRNDAANKIKRHFLSNYKSFILKKKIKKVNYSIELIERDNKKEISINQFLKTENNVLIRLYSIRTKNDSLIKLYSEDKKRKKISIMLPVSSDEIEFILRHIFYKLLKANHSFFMHLAAVIHKGEAYLFLGDSKAGKSTLVKLLKKYMLPICDDRGIIKKEKDLYYLYQSQYKEKNSYQKNSNGFKINKIFFLKKSINFKIQKIPSINLTLLLKYVANQALINKNSKDLFNFIFQHKEKFYYLYFSNKDKDLAKKILNFNEFNSD